MAETGIRSQGAGHMDILKRVIGAYLVLVAVAVAANWVITPLIDNSSGEYPIWRVLNWLMSPGVILALIVNFARKFSFRESADTGVTRAYIEVNMAFYASIVLGLWWFWNWFHSIFPDNEPDVVGLIHLEWWAFINPLMVITLGATGAYLWKSASNDDPA